MTWFPLAFIPPQLVDANGTPYSGAVLKAYSAGTSTVISMATSSAGTTTATSFALNASGYPVSSGNVIIPHAQVACKLALYATQAAADANSGALWSYDDIQVAASDNATRYINYAVDTGTANAYVVAPSPSISSYTTGDVVTLIPINANTGACTLAVSGLSAKNIKTQAGADPVANNMITTGIYQLVYNGTNFVLQNPSQSSATYSGAQIVGTTALTSTAASIAVNLSANNNFSHTFTENTTLANPTSIVAGQSGSFQLTQHASSPKTLAYGSYYKFPGGTVPTVTATNSAIDTLYYSVRSSTIIECNLVKGFA